jgi:hypothetical protein
VTRPANPAAVIDTGGYLQACEWLDASDAASMVARVDEVAHDEAALARLGVWVERYFGDPTPGVATARFHAAVDRLMAEWERFAALHAGDAEIDESDLRGREADDEGDSITV